MTRKNPISVLVLGASYGLLPAARIAAAGHPVTVVCRAEECASIARSGISIAMPERGTGPVFDLRQPAHAGPGKVGSIGLVTPEDVTPDAFDIAILAMQEPQFAAPEIAKIAGLIAQAKLPILSLQNMPPPPFLKRIGLDAALFDAAYSAPDVWAKFDPELFTLASPDAQAIRKDPTNPGALTITLATNFKVAPFAAVAAQTLLERLARDVDASRPEGHHPSVRIVASPHLHAPLAKWPMLICGNCRCMRRGGAPVSIAAAVHEDLAASRAIYDWCADIVRKLGAPEGALVDFDRYAEVARDLVLPSSLARGLAAGVLAVERIDLLMTSVTRYVGVDPAPLAPITRMIDAQLGKQDRLTRVA